MPLIAYSEFVNRVKQQVFPDTDGSLEPVNLRFPHTTYIQNALITAQTYVECLRQNNVNTYQLDDATVNCGVAIFDLPDHARAGAVYAYKPAKGCTRQHYSQKSVNAIMCYVDGFSGCKCKDESDICNAVRSGDAVCDNLSLCDDWDTETGESDTSWLCEDKIFAVGAGGKLYVAPRIPCGYRLAFHWEGIKYRYADADLISDDPDLLDLVSTYVQAERARTFDRDLPLWKELFGNGPGRRGIGASAFHVKLSAMVHRCREERRIRTRSCSEMWDDSAVSSENIGANLNPVPDRSDEGVEFERCDGCPEGQVLVDGECVDCGLPTVSLTADDTALVTGQAVTLTFGSAGVIDLESSEVTLEYDGHSVQLEPNESGSISFVPDADTTYTIRANTVCGEDVTASVTVTVSDDIEGCDCPDNLPECLEISGFDDATFTDRVRVGFIADWGQIANVPNPGNVEALVQSHAPDYIVTGGDNKYGATFEAVLDALPYYKSIVEAEKMFPTFGNHDLGDGGGIAEELPFFSYLPGDKRNYSKKLGPIEFFFRETHDTGTAPPDLAASALWLEAALAASTARWKVVVTQDPPNTSTSTADYPGHAQSQLDYGGMGADLVLSGDSHQYERFDDSTNAGCPAIVCGLGGAVKDATFNVTPVSGSVFRYGAEYGALIIDATGEELSVQFRNTAGTLIDSLTLTKDDGLIACVTGNASVAPAWDGTLERVSDSCLWGFQLGTKSYLDQSIGAFILLDSCDEGNPVYRLQVLMATENGADILWNGTSNGTPVGTYVRDESITCGPLSVTVLGCECDDAELNITFTPPSGANVSFPTNVIISCDDETALLFYTTDGSVPTNNSTPYVGPILLAEGDTLKAIAVSGSGCISTVANADYIAVEGFHFDLICDEVDRVGIFDEFEANGDSGDYHWTLHFGLEDAKTIKRVEIYETNPQGVWVTGQAWATNSPIYPVELDGDPFAVYPLVIDSEGSQLNSAYAAELISLTADNYVWQMYGQPFVPLTGYFKLLFVMDDGAGGDDIIYKLISHDCYYCADYYTFGNCDPVEDERSTNILNVALRFGEESAKTGAAAVGLSGDYWNSFSWEAAATVLDLKWANGTDSPVTFLESSDEGGLATIFSAPFTTFHADAMMRAGGVVKSDSYTKQLRFVNLGHGNYDVYVYGHGALDANILTASAVSVTINRPEQSTEAGSAWNGPFVEGKNYIKFTNVSFAPNEEPTLAIQFAADQASYIQGIQIVKKA